MAFPVIDKANAFLDLFCDPDTSPEDRRRIALLVGLSFIGIVMLTLFAITAHLQGNATLALVDSTIAIILTINVLDAKRRHQFEVNIRVGTVFISLFYVYLYVSGGISKTAFVWYYTYPLITCYLLGSYHGAVKSTLMLLPVLALAGSSLRNPFLRNTASPSWRASLQRTWSSSCFPTCSKEPGKATGRN